MKRYIWPNAALITWLGCHPERGEIVIVSVAKLSS